VIEPGAVFDIPATLARPPQAAHRDNQPRRERRWVVVISSQAHCDDPSQLTVLAVLLSAQTEFGGDHDVTILRGEAVLRDSIAQGDLVFTLAKADLTAAHYRGTVLADTLIRVRAAVARVIGLIRD
jgi:hypothetical protein